MTGARKSAFSFIAEADVSQTWCLSKPEIPGAKPLERSAVTRQDVRVDRLGSGDEPRVVLAQAPGCPALEQSAPLRLREVQPLNREPLQGGQRRRVVGRGLQQLRDTHDGDDDPATAERG
ncbi:MAG TPA: hypothetical protein VFO84_00660, partial [Dehalococcoidia bacterium]|nr:hypothetical protein [Dehalococcoidia bacterium]